MFGKTSLQSLIPPRLIKLGNRLKEKLWIPVECEYSISTSASKRTYRNLAAAKSEDLIEINSYPFVWGRKYEQSWFKVEIADSAFTSNRFIKWEDEGEATLYFNGMPWYGFDAGHHRAPLPEQSGEIWIESICARTGVWMNDGVSLSLDGSHLKGLSIWERNSRIWELYWDYIVLLDLMEYEYKSNLDSVNDWSRGAGTRQSIDRISPLFRRIMRGLDTFADAYDRGDPDSGILLKAIYQELPANASSLKAVLTGHAHLDLVWLWPESTGVAKAVRTFATANRLLEMYPEFRFAYSQPFSYDCVAEHSPELIDAVKEKIEEGTWEATGGSDVESDTQLPCGEALARSFLVGQSRFLKLRGEMAKVLWLPDVFGYSPCLPQILNQVGIQSFFTTKLTWSNVHSFPYSSFVWEGHDGSQVVVHVTQGEGYNGAQKISELKNLEESHREAGIHNEMLVPTGFGDGGGGVSPEILERARRLRNLSGLPKSEWGSIEEFFERLSSLKEDLPQWKGELYLEYHRGVQTTHGDLKSAFRAAERGLQLLESVQAFAGLGAVEESMWRRVILSQFHDAIPGSSIREVYEEMVPELEAIASKCQQLAKECFVDSGKSAWFNPTGIPQYIYSSEGKQLIPPFSVVEERDYIPTIPVQIEDGGYRLSNARLKAEFNRQGEVVLLKIDGEEIPIEDGLNQLYTYPDHPYMFEAWDIDRGTVGNGQYVAASASIVSEVSPEGNGSVSFSRKLSDNSSIVVRYTLLPDSPLLDITWEIDWNDREVLLKSVLSTGYKGKMARYGAPFGSILRDQHPGETRAEAMFEVPASRWAMVSDDSELEGLFIVTESKYGFSARKGSLGLSLLRSALITEADLHTQIRDVANEETFSDMGRHVIRACLGHYTPKKAREELPASVAECRYQLPIGVKASAQTCGFKGLSGGDSLIPVWIKPEENGYIVRLSESMGRRGQAEILLDQGYQLELVNLLGEPEERKQLNGSSLSFMPYDLLSLKITRSS